MPKKRSKRKTTKSGAKRKTEREITTEDLTINDFADVKDAQEKLKQISRGHSQKPVFNLVRRKKEELLWYERDDLESENEYSADGESPNDLNEVEETALAKPSRKKDNKRGKSKTKRTGQDSSRNANSFSGDFTYPLDLWYLISKFLLPEDVCNFSLICQGTRAVINSVKFWLSLYKRHVRDPDKLPCELRPDRIECRPGLRPRVVRALFYGYGPLKSRIIQRADTCHDPPDNLLHYTCSSTWCKRMIAKGEKKVWVFYFKLSERTGVRRPQRFTPEWFDTVDYVNDNPEERNAVLSVICMNYIPVVPVIGLVLTEVLVGLSSGMKHNRVKLRFHGHQSEGRYQQESGVQLILDPVSDIRVLHWWHPMYPYAMA